MSRRPVSVLLVVAAGLVVASQPADVAANRAFLRKMQGLLEQVGEIQCPNDGGDAAWNEYCDGSDGTGAVAPCPTLGDEPNADFYTEHCILSYIYSKASEWPEEAFTTDASTRTALDELYENLPPEHCGFNSSSNCRRDEAVCDRATSKEGVCLRLDEVCQNDQHEKLCHTTGQPYLLKAALFPSSLLTRHFPTLAGKQPEWMYRYFNIIIIFGFVFGMVLMLGIVHMSKRACRVYYRRRRAHQDGDREGSHKLLNAHVLQGQKKTQHASQPGASIASSLAAGTRPTVLTISPTKEANPYPRVTPV